MKSWFAALDGREQKFVLTAAVVLAFAVLYLAIWMPLDKGHEQAAAGVEIWQSSLEKLKPLKSSMAGDSVGRISRARSTTTALAACVAVTRWTWRSRRRAAMHHATATTTESRTIST